MREFALDIYAVGDRTVPAGWSCQNLIYRQRLYYIKGGIGFMIDSCGNTIRFQKGNIYIIPINMAPKFTSDPSDPIDHIYYDFITTPPIISTGPIIYNGNDCSTVSSLIHSTECMCKEIAKETNISKEELEISTHILYKNKEYINIFKGSLTALLSKLSLEHPLPFLEEEIVIKVLDSISRHYMDPISITELAKESGYTVQHLIRKFKQAMGMTPYAYLRIYRLTRAIEFLGSGMTVAEASTRVGYDTSASLFRALKQENLK